MGAIPIHDERGTRFEGDKVAEQFVKHFKQFLGESVPVNKLQGCSDLFKKKLSSKEAMFMVREVSNAEIKKAMFMIDDNKAPGPDGYTLHFYKKAWIIIGNDVCKALKEFFDTGRILSEINSTIIALIQDNILISQEFLKGYDRKNGPKRVALKIDLQKAYDTVNWNFLEDILNGFGFHGKMVNWIMKCVTSTSFSIVVNGESYGFFKEGRGIRQWDPISPYLFTLVMEILNLLMVRRVDNSGLFQFHFGCKQLKITHVCFVDDLLMFYHGDHDSVKVIKEIDKILDVVPFRVEKLPVRYLGVPLITKRIIVRECKSLVDKVRNIILSWKNKVLSYAGRLQLDQSDHVNGKAKVAWKNLSMPKAKEGLRTIWEVNEDSNDSWGWRNILKMRQEARMHMETVSWKDLVWFSQNIPKHAFILWLAIKGNLKTQDKIRKWGTYDMLPYPLCFNDIDSHNHLFFRCEYAKKFWLMVNKKIEVRINERDWESIVNKFVDMRNRNSIGSVVRRLCLAASVYLIWQERNNRLFKNKKRNVDDLFTVLVNTIQQRLCSLKVKRSQVVHKVEIRWNVKLMALKSPLVFLSCSEWPWEGLDAFKDHLVLGTGRCTISHADAKVDRMDLLKGVCFCLVMPTSKGPISISSGGAIWKSSKEDDGGLMVILAWTQEICGGKEEDVGLDGLGEGGKGVVSKIREFGEDLGSELFGDRGGDDMLGISLKWDVFDE
ncbi:RNA-directed DNA polymerase, eukaryota, reverse transcriptase zinc-binding domain protein [Tanacetum coccineum]